MIIISKYVSSRSVTTGEGHENTFRYRKYINKLGAIEIENLGMPFKFNPLVKEDESWVVDNGKGILSSPIISVTLNHSLSKSTITITTKHSLYEFLSLS